MVDAANTARGIGPGAVPGLALVAGDVLTAGRVLAGTARQVKLPSGHLAELHEVIWPEAAEADGRRRLRYRFVAPAIGGADPEAVAGDMQFLCDTLVLPALTPERPKVDEIVITLMARPVPFGSSAPGVPQFIDAFRPLGDHCEWEGL